MRRAGRGRAVRSPAAWSDRIRRRLHDLQHKLPALGRCVVVTDREFRFDLDSCDVDLVEILQLADDAGRSGLSGPALLAGSMVRALEDAVAAAAAEPPLQWDELEYTVNRGRGQSGEHVRALRAGSWRRAGRSRPTSAPTTSRGDPPDRR